MKRNRIIEAILIIIFLWIIMGITDYKRVHGFEKPLFCIAMQTFDDGGSGHYVGLGYSFDIKGNFLPLDEFPGVTQYSFYLFGKEMDNGIRD